MPSQQDQEQPWKKWLATEQNETKEGESKKEWQTWKPNAENPAEKPWMIWNKGEGLRDDRPGNAASFPNGEESVSLQ